VAGWLLKKNFIAAFLSEELVLKEVLILEFYLVIETPQHDNICNVAKNQRDLRAIVRSYINS
jgi:hypothetical protein